MARQIRRDSIAHLDILGRPVAEEAAKRKKLKDATPTSRRVTKTDLARYLNAWAQRPDLVSQGSRKNFDEFMEEVAGDDQASTPTLPGVNAYKLIIAKAILFRRTSALVRPMFPAFQANVAAYVVAVVSKLVGAQPILHSAHWPSFVRHNQRSADQAPDSSHQCDGNPLEGGPAGDEGRPGDGPPAART